MKKVDGFVFASKGAVRKTGVKRPLEEVADVAAAPVSIASEELSPVKDLTQVLRLSTPRLEASFRTSNENPHTSILKYFEAVETLMKSHVLSKYEQKAAVRNGVNKFFESFIAESKKRLQLETVEPTVNFLKNKKNVENEMKKASTVDLLVKYKEELLQWNGLMDSLQEKCKSNENFSDDDMDASYLKDYPIIEGFDDILRDQVSNTFAETDKLFKAIHSCKAEVVVADNLVREKNAILRRKAFSDLPSSSSVLQAVLSKKDSSNVSQKSSDSLSTNFTLSSGSVHVPQ